MSVKQQLAHNTVAQISGKIISTIFGLVAIGIMTRYLGTEQFGWYVTTLAFLQFIAILIDFGLVPVTAQMMSEVPKDLTTADTTTRESYRRTLMRNLLGYRATTAVIGLGLAPLIALFFPYPIEVKIAISFTTINMLAVALNQIFTGYYQSTLKMYVIVLGEVVGRVALVLGLILCIYFGLGFLPVMGAITVSSVLFTGVVWLHARTVTDVGFSYDALIWRRITHKMWPLAVAIMFNVIYLRGDTVILSIFRDQTEVGMYGAAYRVVDIVAQTAMMIMGLMLPLLAYAWSTKNVRQFREHLQLSFDIMMMFAIPMTAGLMILAHPIIVFVAGESFAAAALPLSLLALAIFGVFVGAIFGHVVVAIDRQKQVLPLYALTAGITLVGYLIFIPTFGMYGAAIMTLFSEFFIGILLYRFVYKHAQIALSFQTTGKILFCAGIMCATLLFTRSIPLVISILLGASIYALALVSTRAVSPATIRDILMIKQK